MSSYRLPALPAAADPEPCTAYLVASGDSRLAANQLGWPTQVELESGIRAAFTKAGWQVVRAHREDPAKGHGFIDSQRMGLEVFASVPPTAPVIVAEAVWHYSHHVLPGLRTHRGPILTVANFSGKWPGLVGLLGLNAGLTKMGKPYSTAWSADFTDEWFLDAVECWTRTGEITHDQSHVRPLPDLPPSDEHELGIALARQIQREKAILGVFDEGCMGMYNAIIDDELLNPLGIYKERLSQSALYAEMRTVGDEEAAAVRNWLVTAGMTFRTGTDSATELTEEQLTQQFKMYIAAARLADDFRLDGIGIQYQQGLKDLVPASDLAEGLLNNAVRPPVLSRDGVRVLRDGRPIPHFNEVDEGAAVDMLITGRIWEAMGMDPATTLHDVRWGDDYDGQFVWVLEISGSVPPSHLEGGYAGAESWRQNPMYFPAGGGTIRGVSKAGEIVWSRIFIEGGRLRADLGRGQAVALPAAETERRWQATNPEWPMMHAVFPGITRDQFMARHKANHIQVAYAESSERADRAAIAKAAMLAALGIDVHLCGDVAGFAPPARRKKA